MIDVDRIVKEQSEKINMPEDKKQNFVNTATFIGNFLNCIWSEKENKNENK